jgi:spermidine synthase
VIWFQENLHSDIVDNGYAQRIKMTALLHEEQTPFQHAQVFQSHAFGRVLVLDGIVQTTEADEFIYHEMLAHVPLFAHGRPRRILIIGGGDGGILREVLRHPLDQATMVEIDGAVIAMSREYLPKLSAGAFDDPRAQVIVGDGLDFVSKTSESFDVIIVDSTDPVGPGECLFTAEFYADCRRILASGGIVVTQNGVPFFQPDEMTDTARRLRPAFADVSCYLITVPTYCGGHMALGWASQDASLRQVSLDVLQTRFAEATLATRYYTPDVHRAAFALPPWIAHLISHSA